MKKQKIPMISLLVFLLGCGTSPQPVPKHLDATMIVSKIEMCPSWAYMDVEDKESVKQLMEALMDLKNCDCDLLRQAIVQYVETKEKSEGYDLNCSSKLFVLNRFLFNVPDKVSIKEPHFGGWMIPYDDKTANHLWPFVRKDGQLVLTGSFQGYYGASYDAVGEFDYFRRVYGVRVK